MCGLDEAVCVFGAVVSTQGGACARLESNQHQCLIQFPIWVQHFHHKELAYLERHHTSITPFRNATEGERLKAKTDWMRGMGRGPGGCAEYPSWFVRR